MLPAILVFLLGAGVVFGGFMAVTALPGMLARRRLEARLQDVASPNEAAQGDETVVKNLSEGPLPAVDRMIASTAAGSRLARLIEQSGCNTTPGGLMVATFGAALAGGLMGAFFARQWFVAPIGAVLSGAAPIVYILQQRSSRISKFEEQFPEALDLLSRALRAGHAFQTALGMIGDEMKAPVGPEFKKTFDQQNYGLPLRDALNQMGERIPLLDVKFFVTAVLIQRETGGNLSEILDNLAHVVRERFKILRQVRVHTAHGRFTAFVLLSLPAFLGFALSWLNPEHMAPLFHEHAGKQMLLGAMILQAIGFVWIRKVIKIEV